VIRENISLDWTSAGATAFTSKQPGYDFRKFLVFLTCRQI
jgi:hypothetical protein